MQALKMMCMSLAMLACAYYGAVANHEAKKLRAQAAGA